MEEDAYTSAWYSDPEKVARQLRKEGGLLHPFTYTRH